jgi:hypothetical protein
MAGIICFDDEPVDALEQMMHISESDARAARISSAQVRHPPPDDDLASLEQSEGYDRYCGFLHSKLAACVVSPAPLYRAT